MPKDAAQSVGTERLRMIRKAHDKWSEDFLRGFGAFLKERGFRKDGIRWIRDLNGIRQIVALQRSQWAEGSYYVNLGATAITSDRRPTTDTSQCRVQCRWSALISEPMEADKVEKLLEFGPGVDAEEKLSHALRILEEHVLPFYDRLSSTEKLGEFAQSNSNPRIVVVPEHLAL